MASRTQLLAKKGLIKPPAFLPNNVHYEVMSGSVSYGVSSDSSDIDLVGFCMPEKEVVFPHLAGEIFGFGTQKKRFDQFQAHHVEDKESGKQYDLTIYNIVRYFQLCMEGNPNMVDSLFVHESCVLHSTAVAQMVRDHRHLFLHKGMYTKFKGYAFSQLHKMELKNPVGKRKELVDKYGYDVKFAYHVVRLLDEIEQILELGTLDLMRNREQLKAIRRGEYTLDQIKQHFGWKESTLDDLYANSPLSAKPREAEIKQLLLDCLEHHYGSLEQAITIVSPYERAVRDIRAILDRI